MSSFAAYLRTRVFQPSTILGLMGLGAAVISTGGNITPAIVPQILACFGLVHIDESKAQ